MRAASALSCRACHSARSSCTKSTGTGVPSLSAAARYSSNRAATVFKCRFVSNCSSSSFIGFVRGGEHEVFACDLLEHHSFESIKIKEPILLGEDEGAQEGGARIVTQHREQAPQRQAPGTDREFECRHVSSELWLEGQQLDLLGRRLRPQLVPEATRRAMYGVRHARIERSLHARMGRDPPRPLIQ